ncbi:MAG: tetratricopeptide repeat protein [Sulfolobaceae archaeon]|nr:tetratricopeptide repeat protein [Sulfolobaceae archaeon]
MNNDLEELLKEGKYDELENKITQLLKTRDDPAYHYYLALSYFFRKKYSKGYKEALKAVRGSPENPIYLFTLIKIAYNLSRETSNDKRLKEAYNLLSKLEALDKEKKIVESDEYLLLKSNILYDMGMYDEGLKELEKIKNKDALDYFKLKADILYNLKRYSEAIENYNQALKYDPNNSEIHYALALSYEKLNKTDEAIGEIEKAINIDPENPYYYEEKSKILTLKGDKDGAMENIEKALSIDPDNPLLISTKIFILLSFNLKDKALNVLKEFSEGSVKEEMEALCEDLEARKAEAKSQEMKDSIEEIQLKYC